MAKELLRNDDFALYEVALKCPHCRAADVTANVRVTIAKDADHMNAYEVVRIVLPHFVTAKQREQLDIAACFGAMRTFHATPEFAVRLAKHSFDVFTAPSPSAFAGN